MPQNDSGTTKPERFSPTQIARMEAGIDWITWVEPKDCGTTIATELGQLMIDQALADGSKVRRFSFEGYHGWQTTAASIGFRSDSALLRLSGSRAAGRWTHLRTSAGHPTRLDVQTSLTLSKPDGGLGKRFLLRAENSSRRPRRTRLRSTITRGSDGAWCGTVGSRTSRAYVRVYDKGVEQGTQAPGVWWRYELEAKRDLAAALWADLSAADDPTAWCVGCCARSSYSLGLRWPSFLSKQRTPLPPVPPRVPPDVVQSLMWLREQVRPTVQRLSTAVPPQVLLNALGLNQIAEVRIPNASEDDTWPTG